MTWARMRRWLAITGLVISYTLGAFICVVAAIVVYRNPGA